MIAVDTNLLTRDILRGDDIQAERGRRAFEIGERVLITGVVSAETLWTLTRRHYRADRSDLIAVVYNLSQDLTVCFEDDGVIWNPLLADRETDALFADYLAVSKAQKTAAGVEPEALYTFDAATMQLPTAAQL